MSILLFVHIYNKMLLVGPAITFEVLSFIVSFIASFIALVIGPLVMRIRAETQQPSKHFRFQLHVSNFATNYLDQVAEHHRQS